MAEGGVDLEALQQRLADLQIQVDQQRTAQAAAANAAATNAVNAVESLQLPAFWPLAPEDWFAVITQAAGMDAPPAEGGRLHLP